MPVITTESIETAFGAYLLSLPDLVDAVAVDEKNLPAIYANRGLQDSQADPYISWRFSKNVPEQLVGGAPDVLDAEVMLSCYSKNYDRAKTTAWIVVQLLQFLQEPIRIGSTDEYIVLGHWIIDCYDSDEANTIGLFETIVQVGLQVQIDLPF